MAVAGNQPVSSFTEASHRLVGFGAHIQKGLSWFGRTLMEAQAHRARIQQVQALNAKSDAELADIGLRREDIVRHVYSDIFYI